MKYVTCFSGNWLRLKQFLLLIICLLSIFLLYKLVQASHDIIRKTSPKPNLLIVKSKPKAHPKRKTQTPRTIIDIPDPFDVYIVSTYYYPTSESLGNNGVALAMVPPAKWMQAVNHTITVRASSDLQSRTSSCKVERTDKTYRCILHSAFAGCFGVPNMTRFEISLGNDTFHEIPFKTASYEKKDVVTCVAPLFAAEQWHQIIFAAHIYRKYGSFMHLYIRSVVAPVYELIKAYEQEGYLKSQAYPRLNYSSIPSYMFNPNRNVLWRAQESAQTDCLLQYKESAQFITFMDLDDVLLPRAAPTYLEEFNLFIHNGHFVHYNKANAYYEASNDSQSFSMFDIFHSTRFLDQIEYGKIAVKPKYVNHTCIHWVEKNRKHPGYYTPSSQNVIVHLKKAYPLGHANGRRQLWDYFYRNDTTIFNDKDSLMMEVDYRRIRSKYPEVWRNLPSTLEYFPIILDCYNKKFYNYWYAGEKAKSQMTWCVNPDMCRIPPKLIAPCANADADYFSSEEGKLMNVHYPKNHRFTIQDQCIP